MRAFPFLALLIFFLAFAGCKKETVTWAALGEAAPEFGKTSELGTLPAFIVGRWCMDELGGPELARYYEFRADGTFETGHTGMEWKSTGKWTESNGLVQLTYETMNGKSKEAFQAEYKKDEEGGGQVAVQRALVYDGVYSELDKLTSLAVGEDNRSLTFGGKPMANAPDPSPAHEEGGEGGDSLQEDLQSMGATLVRLGPKKG